MARSEATKMGLLKKIRFILWDKSPIIRFAFLFSLMIGLFYWWWSGLSFEGPFLKTVLGTNAKLGSGLLNVFGFETKAAEEIVSNNEFQVSIKAGCDGIEPTFFYAAAVMAFPMAISKKLIGLAVGVPTLLILNIFRVFTLFILGVKAPSLFEAFHVGVWQALFIGFGILFWLIWINWASKEKVTQDA